MSEENQNFVYDGFNVADPEIEGWDGQGGGGTAVPEGEHAFEVIGCKIVNTKKGDGKNFEVEYKVVSEQALGETLRCWYLCQGEKFGRPHKGRIVQVFRNALRVPMEANGAIETKNVIGCRMYATVKHETSEKYDADSQTTKTYTNAGLSMERPIEDEASQATAATAPKAPTAPPSRPPAPAATGNRAPAPPARGSAAPPVRPR